MLRVLIIILGGYFIAGARLGLGKCKVVFVSSLGILQSSRPMGAAALVVC